MDLPEVLANIVSFMDDGSEFEEHRNWARSVPDGFFYQSPVWQFNALAQTSPLAYELCAPRARRVKKSFGVLFPDLRKQLMFAEMWWRSQNFLKQLRQERKEREERLASLALTN